MERAPVLAASEIFGSLSPAAWRWLTAHWTTAELAAGQNLYTPNEAGEVLFLVRRGRVELYGQRNGERYTVATLGPGALFGQIPLLGLTLRRLWAVAASSCAVYTLSQAQVEALIRAEPQVALSVLAAAGPRLLAAEAAVEG